MAFTLAGSSSPAKDQRFRIIPEFAVLAEVDRERATAEHGMEWRAQARCVESVCAHHLPREVADDTEPPKSASLSSFDGPISWRRPYPTNG